MALKYWYSDGTNQAWDAVATTMSVTGTGAFSFNGHSYVVAGTYSPITARNGYPAWQQAGVTYACVLFYDYSYEGYLVVADGDDSYMAGFYIDGTNPIGQYSGIGGGESGTCEVASAGTGNYLNWWNAWDEQNSRPVTGSLSSTLPADGVDGIAFCGGNPPYTGPAAAISLVSVDDSRFTGWMGGISSSVTGNIKIAAGGTLTWTGGNGYMGQNTWAGDASAAGVTCNITGGNIGDPWGGSPAKFGDNMAINGGTVNSATFGANPTFGGYCSLGNPYQYQWGQVTVAGGAVLRGGACLYGGIQTTAPGDVVFMESASVGNDSYYYGGPAGSLSLYNGSVIWQSTAAFTCSSVSAIAVCLYKALALSNVNCPVYLMTWDASGTGNGMVNLSKLPRGGGVMNLNGW